MSHYLHPRYLFISASIYLFTVQSQLTSIILRPRTKIKSSAISSSNARSFHNQFSLQGSWCKVFKRDWQFLPKILQRYKQKCFFFSNIIIVRTNVSVVTCATPKLSKIIIRFSAQKSKVMHCFLHAYLFRTGMALMNDSRQFRYIYDSDQ